MTYRNTARYLWSVLVVLAGAASLTSGAIAQPVIQEVESHQTAFFWRRQSAPDRLEGVWGITEGKTPRGQAYTGSLDITAIGNTDNLYQVSWETSEGNYSGLGFYEEGRLLVGAGLDEEIYGVALYRIQDDGTLDGKWTLSSAEGEVGTELATGGRSGELAGSYQISSTDPGEEDSAFSGELTITQSRDTYQVTWNVDDQTYRGIGLRVDDWLVVGWGTSSNLAVLDYEFKGNEATARWARTGSRELGMEKISLED
ncbi:hypothetical protein [Laspinema olomoucense]|uniref:hypothetical protein n=1 Tax=Laspinema olomoucense TaxID=3231600 RepID=UPI0021BB80A3|nr:MULTISPECIES: hypothetical protein [unclassified Laspinema]MCT7970907.1 hypothetical protein [Laspinema sp. D3d]MCT7991010.1 hypothetical protein [Laspinema sp. D3a]